jgi:hypothetical protein
MERELGSVNEHWINQQINRRRFDGQVVCVRVTVNESDLNMVLSTPTCPSNGCGGRPPRPHEREVFNLWDKHKLNEIEFTGGNLIGFLKRLKRTV